MKNRSPEQIVNSINENDVEYVNWEEYKAVLKYLSKNGVSHDALYWELTSFGEKHFPKIKISL